MPDVPRFHLAIPVDDLDAASAFYGELLGCRMGRRSPDWIDWDFFGHQLVTHRVDPDARAADTTNPVDGHAVPVPHFGVILSIPEFHQITSRFEAAGVRPEVGPYVRFEGQPGEQWTVFVRDPAGNALELKAFARDTDVFRVT